MNSSVFVSYCMMLSLGMTYFYGEAKEYFNHPDPYLDRIENLKQEVEQEKLRHLMTSYEFEDFRQHTATVLPKAIQMQGPSKEKTYPLRSLASVVQKSSGDKLKTHRSKQIFEEARALFRSKKYSKAVSHLDELLEDHSYSAHIVEALFLKIESHFQLREFDQATRTLEKMVELYPSNELTGYGMLRVGKIYEFQDRHDDAVRIYETVLQAFSDRSLASVAKESLRTVEL